MRQLSDAAHGGVADASHGVVHHAFESLVVAGVDYEADVGQHVLYLLVVVERAALVDAIGDAATPQRGLHRGRLVVGAVEHHHLVPAVARLAYAVAHGVGHCVGLLAVGVALHDADLVARVAVGEALLVHAARVALDHRVGGVDYGAGRTVVLLQLEHLRRGIVVAEREYVFDLRAAERVDALGVVAHHAHPRMKLREAADDDVLRIVGVLVLVDQDVLEQLLIAGQHVGAVAQQEIGLQQQVVEIHRAVLLGAAAVGVVYLAETGHLHLTVLGRIGRVGGVRRGGDEAVFGERDARKHLVGLILVVGEVHLLADGLYEVLAVRGLVDGEALRIAYAVGVLAQNARKDRVERAHAYAAARRAPHHLLDAGAHLLGGLVGKGQGQNVVRLHPLLQHVGYARGEHAGLARARSRYDERRRIVIDHGVVLRLVESLQYFGFHKSLSGKFRTRRRRSAAHASAKLGNNRESERIGRRITLG